MQVSKYNHFIPFSKEQSIAYNACSNALALISKEKLDEYYNFVENGKEIEDERLKNDLLHGSFLLEDGIEELDIVRYNMLRARYATNVLTLTIAPTSDCNFRCAYCYEKNVLKPNYMTMEIQEAVVKIVESQKDNLKALSVVWYGGEPLLAISIIKELSFRFMQICEEVGIEYSAHMITNGFLLTRENLKILKELKVNFLQVTLDGKPEQHNQRRPLKGGGETFNVILDNLKNGYDLLSRVSLRINIDRENMDVGPLINSYLEKFNISDKVIPYYGCVRNDNDCYDDNKCINTCEFAELEYEFSLEVNNRRSHYPVRKSTFCCADRVCGYVIAADGLLYKCWSDIGNINKSVGNILESFNVLSKTYLTYMMFDPTQILPCKECDILPICMGGCPFQRAIRGEEQCSNYKYILKRCLIDAVNGITKTNE